MGKADDNVMMRKNRGMVGGQVVYRLRKGVTVVANAPKKNPNRVVSATQAAIRKVFTSALKFARKLKNNPELKATYEAGATGGQTAYNVALSDATKAPEVVSIDHSAYTGAVGQVLVIEATDNFKVDKVFVVITEANGTVLEQGPAVENEQTDNWEYTTLQTNATVTGTKITATASDIPGNTATLAVTL